jgi:hypothetical protein
MDNPAGNILEPRQLFGEMLAPTPSGFPTSSPSIGTLKHLQKYEIKHRRTMMMMIL